MKNLIILIISSLFLATSCSREKPILQTQTDSNGVFISLPYHWKKSLHKKEVSSNSTVSEAVYYNGNIAIPTTNGSNNRELSLINSENGDYIWSWDDRYQPETERIMIDYVLIHNNLLTYQMGTRSYCINLDNGKTQWKYRREKPLRISNRINSFESNYLTYGSIINEEGNREFVAYLGDINSGNLTEFLRANISSPYVNPNNSVGGIEYVGKVQENDSLLLVNYFEPLPDWKIKPFIGLYNIITKQWVWDDIQLIDTPTLNSGLYGLPKFHNNKVIISIGNNLVCHDLETGEQIWRKSFPQDFLFSGFIIEEDKIIANCEDTYTYCLNPENGNTIWRTETSGTSGRMSYLNGIVYFVGGSTGRLHAIDVNTGKHVWKLDADLFEGDNTNTKTFKTNAVYVFPAKGNKPAKVIALSHLYAYCFKAYR